MSLNTEEFHAHEVKLFEAINVGDHLAALDVMIAIDTALMGESNFVPGGPMRFYREHDMKKFVEHVKKGKDDCYNAVKLSDGDTKLRIWCKQGVLSTQWASDSGDMKMWDQLSKSM